MTTRFTLVLTLLQLATLTACGLDPAPDDGGLDPGFTECGEVTCQPGQYCFGGGITWRCATQIEGLKAAVPFYGPAPDLEDVPNIKAAVLGVYAGLDERINAGIEPLRAALDAAGVTYEIKIYPDVNHAFHNDTGERYVEAQATQAAETERARQALEREAERTRLEEAARQREEETRRWQEEAAAALVPQADDQATDAYAVLGLEPTASELEIHFAYQDAIAKCAPDQVAHLGEELRNRYTAKAKIVQQAYETLTTPTPSH